MDTYVVWIDYQGKWHCYSEGWYPDLYTRANARKMAQILTGQVEGTSDLIGIATAAFCVYAPSRYKAMQVVRKRYLVNG